MEQLRVQGNVGNRDVSQTGIASLLHVTVVLLNAPGPTGERQERLDAIIATYKHI